MDWTAIIVGVGSGISTGALAAFLTPWAQWAVDVRRDRRDNRLKFIQAWKIYVNNRYMHELSQNADFPSLVRTLTPTKRDQLQRLLKQYQLNWNEFEKEKLPSMDDYDKPDTINAEKERLGKPIRDFLIEHLAELREKWKVI